MNTLSRLAATASPRPRARLSNARRILTVASIALSMPLLAACTSSGSDASSSGAPGTANPGATSSSSDFAEPTIGANGDPFCDLAVSAQAQARELDSTTSEFSDLMTNVVSGTAPIGDLNAWGSTLYDLATSSLQFYDDAAPYVAGTDGEAPFADTREFVSSYSIKIAEMARDAPDSDTFMTQVGDFVQTPEVQSAITTGPQAAQAMAAYIADRCPTTS